MLYLKALNMEDACREHAFFQSLPSENGFENPYEGISLADFRNTAVPHRLAASRGENLAPGHVPDTYYLLWQDDMIVGLFKVRPRLNEQLRAGSGHVGYGILPACRGQGFGTEGLRLTIALLKKLPEFTDREVYLSCSTGNPASLRVMLHNGGYIHHSDADRHYVRIPI